MPTVFHGNPNKLHRWKSPQMISGQWKHKELQILIFTPTEASKSATELTYSNLMTYISRSSLITAKNILVGANLSRCLAWRGSCLNLNSLNSSRRRVKAPDICISLAQRWVILQTSNFCFHLCAGVFQLRLKFCVEFCKERIVMTSL